MLENLLLFQMFQMLTNIRALSICRILYRSFFKDSDVDFLCSSFQSLEIFQTEQSFKANRFNRKTKILWEN